MAAAFTYYLSNAILNEAFRNTEFSQPTTVYAALFTTATTRSGGGTEVSGNNYVRQAITFSAASNGVVSNSGTITFPTATGSWGTVTHFAIMSASTAGNMLIQGELASQRTISTGETFTINAGDIVITG